VSVLEAAWAQLHSLRLVRTARGRLVLSRAGAGALADPAALLRSLATVLPVDDAPFITEVAAAVLAGLVRAPGRATRGLIDDGLALTARYGDADGRPPTEHEVVAVVYEVLAELRALRVLVPNDPFAAGGDGPRLTADGEAIALVALDRIVTAR
jgi:hypothetical protein